MPATKRPPRQEFEHKFLVVQPELPTKLPKALHIVQFYISLENPLTRIRIYDDVRAVLEIKGDNNFESSPVPFNLEEARWLLENGRKGHRIEKNRYRFAGPKGLHWELDIYEGKNKPLMVAELETPTKDFALDPKTFPTWVGPEISDDKRFKNKVLVLNPFGLWTKSEASEPRRLMGCA